MTEPGGVRLRPLEFSDGPQVLGWRNLPDIARWMYTDHEITVPEHARWLAGAINQSDRRYWIIELDGRPVGLTNLYDIRLDHLRAYWAIYLADPSVRGRGVGSSAQRLVMRYAFEELGLERLCCEALAANEDAIRMYERHGFRVEGTLRQHIRKGSERVDVVTLGLLLDEWAARR